MEFLKAFMARRYMMKSFRTTVKFFAICFAVIIGAILFIVAAALLPGVLFSILLLIGLFFAVWAVVQKYYKDFGYSE